MNNARISQETIEVLGLNAAANARITQEAAEALYLPPTMGVHARVTQQAIEVLYLPPSPIAPTMALASSAMFSYFPLRAAVSRV
jgi:hypothetical protein